MIDWILIFKIGPLAIFAVVMMLDNWRIRGKLFKVRERNSTLANQVATLQAHPDSWQSGYDAGRRMGSMDEMARSYHLDRIYKAPSKTRPVSTAE